VTDDVAAAAEAAGTSDSVTSSGHVSPVSWGKPPSLTSVPAVTRGAVFQRTTPAVFHNE